MTTGGGLRAPTYLDSATHTGVGLTQRSGSRRLQGSKSSFGTVLTRGVDSRFGKRRISFEPRLITTWSPWAKGWRRQRSRKTCATSVRDSWPRHQVRGHLAGCNVNTHGRMVNHGSDFPWLVLQGMLDTPDPRNPVA